MFNSPIQKKNYFLANTKESIVCELSDISVKQIQKSRTSSAVLTITLSNHEQDFFENIDKESKMVLYEQSNKWFQNELSVNDIDGLFKSSFCCQNNTINTLISSDTKIYLDHEPYNLDSFSKLCVTSYKKNYMINMKLKHIGMYIYPTYTINRWGVAKINIISNECVDTEVKEELLTFWNSMIEESENVLNSRIQLIEQTKQKMRSLYMEISKEKDFENKLKELKHLIQNIIF